MPVDPRALIEEEGPDVITEALYCGECGYQLKMLPHVGRCPECGNRYKARGTETEGIFNPHSAEFPAFDIVAGLASVLLVVWLVSGVVRSFDLWSTLFAGTFAYLGMVFLRQAWRGVNRFIRGQKIADELHGRSREE